MIYNEKEFKKPITARVEKMREEVVNAKPILCSERALLITESYKETESEPVPIRRALSLKKILDNMTQIIWDGELIVGSHGSNGRRSSPVFPEFAVEWLEEEIDENLEIRSQDQFTVPQEVKDELKSIFPYWRGKTIYDKYRAMLPEDTKIARDSGIFTRGLFENAGYGHNAYDIPKILTVGLKGIKDEIEENLTDLDLTTNEGIERKLFYEAALISCDAVIDYCKRYSKTALDMAKEEKDPVRKKELEKIADVCAWIPENPARDIWDAIQVVQFMQLIVQTETSGDSVSPGRLDQYFYPYYKKDIEEGKYTNGQIQELLDCLWIKLNEIIKVQSTESVRIHPGFPMTPTVTIGGLTPEGEDATNELSFLMLNSQEHIRLTNPQFTARYHENTPNDFKLRAAEIVKLGTGMPAMFGDEKCMESIQKTYPDIPMDRVRDYRIVGCIELAPRGFQGRITGGWFNTARVIDLALNNGIDRLTGEQLGPKSGNVEDFKDFNDVFEAARIQMEYFTKHLVINAGIVDKVQSENTPHIFLSCLTEGCIEKGRDMTRDGSLWGATAAVLVGLATASDSLTAVKKAVFEDKSLSMKELKKAQDSDFAGEKGEEIKQILLSAPKYGNDNDYADEIMRKTTDMFFDIIESHKDIDGRPFTTFVLTLGGTVSRGVETGATADGRKSKAPVSDSMSPTNGADKEGPTGVLLSASKIDQSRTSSGNVVNLKFTKSALGEEKDLQKFVDLTDTYLLDLKGQEVQVNVVDGETLRDAQKNPQNYQDLIIRVAGYSTRFVELAKELQDDIIFRTEHHAV